MATEARATGTKSGLTLYRLTVRQFETMIDTGVFPDGANVELLGGLLIDLKAKGNPHDFVVGMLGDLIRRALPDDAFVREEKSLKLGRWWRPRPDMAIIRGELNDFRSKGPRARDVGAVMEVADTTYSKDRHTKWRLYAGAKLPTYWIVDISKKQVEVYGGPTGRGRSAAYRDVQIYGIDAEVPVVLDGLEVGRFAVRNLMP